MIRLYILEQWRNQSREGGCGTGGGVQRYHMPFFLEVKELNIDFKICSKYIYKKRLKCFENWLNFVTET